MEQIKCGKEDIRSIRSKGKKVDSGQWVHGYLMINCAHHKGLTFVENGCIYNIGNISSNPWLL